MDDEESTPSRPPENTAKSDSSSIFGGVQKSSFNQGTENLGKIFDSAKSSSQNVPSVFDYSIQKSKFGTSQLDTIEEEKNVAGAPSVFGNVQSTNPPSSSSFQSGSIFGGKTSVEAQDLSVKNTPLTTDSSLVPPFSTVSSNPNTTFSVFDTGEGESKPSPFIFKSSTHPEAFTPPAPVFASQSKSTDSKPSIFGGKPTQKPSTFALTSLDTRGSTEGECGNSSVKPKLRKGDYVADPVDLSTKKPSFTKPSLVFASKLDKKPTTTTSQDNNSMKQSSKKEGKEGSFDIFDSLPKETGDVPLSPQKKSSILIAVDIPKNYLNKSVLQNHFSRFGSLKRIIINSKSNQASIYFDEHKSAAEAKAKGKSLHPLVPEMKLFFGVQPVQKEPEPVKKSGEQPPPQPPPEPLSPILAPPRKSREPVVAKPAAKPVIANPTTSPIQTAVFERTKPLSPAVPKKTESRSKATTSEFRNKAPSTNLLSIKDLSVLMKSEAVNNYDKYLILDARDKNYRSKQKKEVDVSKAQYLLAKCPDMCPEKERYSRDIQYDVSVYEMMNGEIDHRLAVKKFSRSSADKNEPLPHELRPGPVLKMTMNFLICNIMEKGEQSNVQIDLWYNYLCNRTRALRNDITQQHLLDHNAVYVLERCIRFHIHCNHHLADEPLDHFDSKMNSEHLSKSLQSLKELYHDMAEKGVFYETEAEFRAYEILLNMSDGHGIFFKYLKFREVVRNSKAVQFAIMFFHSVNTNNYIRFFRLLNKATYLQACITHRLITHVRKEAIHRLVKVYYLPFLKLNDAAAMLGFTRLQDMHLYIPYYGVTIDKKLNVMTEKENFVSRPPNLPPLGKLRSITAKKTASVGVIIHKGPIPHRDVSHYHPHNSFKAGHLTKGALDASDQLASRDSDPEPETRRHHEPDTLRHKKTSKGRDNAGLHKALRTKVEEMYKIKIYRRYFSIWQKFTKFHKEKKRLDAQAKRLVLKKLAKIWREKAARSAKLNRKADDHLRLKYLRNWMSFTAYSKENKEYVRKAQAVEKGMLARKFVVLWKSKVEFKRSVREAELARKYLVSCKYFTKWRSQTKEALAERKSQTFYASKLLISSFTQWKLWCKMKKNRHSMNLESFPAMPAQYSVEQQNKLLDWGYKREDHLNMDAAQIVELDNEINIKSRKQFSLQQLSGIVAWTALPLLQRFKMDIKSKAPDFSGNIFSRCFKILLVVDSSTDTYLLEWVRINFNIYERDDSSVPLQCKAQFTSHHSGLTYTIIVTEKEFSATSPINLDGASFVALVANEDKLNHLQYSASLLQDVPHLILCKSARDPYLDEDVWAMTKQTIDDPYTSEKLFNHVFDAWQLRSERRYLQAGKCSSILTNYISKKVLDPVYKVVGQRQLYCKGMLCPSKVIEFYNSAIYHARACFEKCKSLCQDWPPSEVLASPTRDFSSKLWDQDDETKVMRALQAALLPPFAVEPGWSWECMERHVAHYIRKVVVMQGWGGTIYSKVMSILKHTRRKLYEDEENYANASDALHQEVPWVQILECCIAYKMSLFPKMLVAYRFTDFEAFDRDERWISVLRTSGMEQQLTPGAKEDTATKRKASLSPHSDAKKQKKVIKSQLLLDIEEEKRKSLDYEHQLKSLLHVEEELKLLYNSYEAYRPT